MRFRLRLLFYFWAASYALVACGNTPEQVVQPTAAMVTSLIEPSNAPEVDPNSDLSQEPDLVVEPSAEPTAAEPTVEPVVSKVIYDLGDTAQITPFQITVKASGEPKADWGTPPSGHRFVAADITLKNIDEQPQNVSMMLQMLLEDAAGHNYGFDARASWEAIFALDGRIPSNEPRQGVVIFQVPEAAEGLHFIFRTITPNTTTEAERVVFDLGA